MAELVAAEVAAKRMGRLAAVLSLRSVGLPHDLASTLIDVAEALAGPDHRPGDYGLPAGGAGGGAFSLIGEAVLGGLGSVKGGSDLVATILQSLGLPGRDRSALVKLLRDLQDPFPREDVPQTGNPPAGPPPPPPLTPTDPHTTPAPPRAA